MNFSAINLGEFGPTGCAVVVIPILTPLSVATKLKSHPDKVRSVVDAPLLFWARHKLSLYLFGLLENKSIGALAGIDPSIVPEVYVERVREPIRALQVLSSPDDVHLSYPTGYRNLERRIG
jgi:hypothetical protein